MERRDYLLTEIEKIGQLLTAIKQKLFGGKENLALRVNQPIEETKELLFDELNFDVDAFLALNSDESIRYLDRFKGFDAANIDGLAHLFSTLGFEEDSARSKEYLEKALQLYTISNLKSRTYSMEREMHILNLKKALE